MSPSHGTAIVKPIMIQSAVEELHASDPTHSSFFSTLFCTSAPVVKAFAAEQRGNVIDPSSPHCYECECSALRAVKIVFFHVLLDFSDPDTDQMGFFLPAFVWNADVSQCSRETSETSRVILYFFLYCLLPCSFYHHILL